MVTVFVITWCLVCLGAVALLLGYLIAVAALAFAQRLFLFALGRLAAR